MAYAAWIGDFSDWFWDEEFWLPPNITWAHLKRNETVFYPDFYDLWIPFPIAFGFIVLRILWEKCVACPLGDYFAVKKRLPRRAVPNPVLETAFHKHRKVLPDHSVITGLSKQVDWTTRQVERWWRRRRAQGKAPEFVRFTECSWRFVFYFFAFWIGLYVLWDKPYLWDTKHSWYNYPLQHVPSDIWWYYMLELGFYWSLVFSLSVDVKRKDSFIMLVHHMVTIFLMVMSWAGNMTRIGGLVLCTHDAVDYLLEGAKMAHYTRYSNLCSFLFAAFTVVWFLSRIVFFPVKILYSTLFEGHVIIGCFTNIYYWYNGLLVILQILHIMWFYMILRMVYSLLIKGHLEKDERSETEPETDSADEKVSFSPLSDSTPSNVSLNGQPSANDEASLKS